MNREDFPILKEDIIYLDSGATTLKPNVLMEKTDEYYRCYSANAHRGDYDISLKVDTLFERTRYLVSNFIGANTNEIAFTNNTTDSMSKIVWGFFEDYLSAGDEVLLSKSEHASNILPWFELAKRKGIVIRYIPLDEHLKITLEAVQNTISEKTKVISLAHITNVVGDIRPIKEIAEIAHQHHILMVCDGAQSVPHMPVDVKDLDVDFLAFSAHKMGGPTGLGVLYGKEQYLRQFRPLIVGGGMNSSFEFDGTVTYNDIPHFFEAGTPNIAAVIGFGAVIEYLNQVGMDKIFAYEHSLRQYAITKLKEVPNIILYNEESESGIITFNIQDVFAQDLAIYLNRYHICVRAGNHCAKILKDDLGIKNTCRISLYFYNNKEEIDRVIEVLKNPHLKEEII